MKKKNAVKLSAAAAVLLLLSGCAAQSRVGDELRSGLLLTLERQQLAAVHAGLERLDALSAARERRRGSVGQEDLFANHEKEKGQRRYKYVFLGQEGTAGRLVIPSVGISVAVNLPGEDAQLTADEPDSACWMEYGYGQNPVIGDHVNQEFSEKNLQFIDSAQRLTEIAWCSFPDLDAACKRRMTHARLSVLRYMEHCPKEYLALRDELRRQVLSSAEAVCEDAKTPKRDKLAIRLLRLGYVPFYASWAMYSRIR